MRILKIALLLLLGISNLALNAQNNSNIPQTFYNLLKKQSFDEIFRLFDTIGMSTSYQQSQKEQLKTVFNELGKPKKLIAIIEDENSVKKQFALCVQFKKEQKNILLSLNKNKKIERYSIKEFNPSPFFQLKGYKGFSEVTNLSITVKTRDGLNLDGNIAFGDTTKQKLPLVIFVHGSGVSDRDESIGPNKPFRDLSQGFAQQGIASIRYDKRGFDYSQISKKTSDSLTIYIETINDAIDAINVAKQFSFIDTNKIFICGHSLGAMCAPKIAELSPKVKGIILLAGPAKSLIDVLPEQARYMALLDDTITNIEEMQLNQNKWFVEKLRNPTEFKKLPKMMLGGTSYKYWQSIDNLNQVQSAKNLTIPIFILNGENDFQVIMDEYKIWEKELQGKSNVKFKSYPKLNHLFLETIGERGMKEYDVPGHIPQYVIDDLTNFILK